ncbi:MAG: hypothetical protein EXS24_00490 [Pedosphaera sp.]|nr:hypothetical protein [Pedosphaera sp.]
MAVAWLFSVVVRLHWIGHVTQEERFMWNGVPLVTTNDSYLFGSIAQKALGGTAAQVADCPGIWDNGVITVLLFLAAKMTGISIDALMVWMPVFIGGLVVIPVFLIGRLYGSTLWGFCAALLASVAQSYYNRTIAGYFDTDMFSVTIPAFALFCLLAAHRNESYRWLVIGAVTLFVFPFFYRPGTPIAYALALAFVGFRLLAHFKETLTWQALLLLGIVLLLLDGSTGRAIAAAPWRWFARAAILCLTAVIIQRTMSSMQAPWKHRGMVAACGLTCFGVAWFSKPISLMNQRVSDYLGAQSADSSQPHADGLKFFNASSLVLEAQTANSINENAFITARRVSGSVIGGLCAIAGLVLLVFRAREFVIALPFAGFAYLAMKGGERFTIHAVPIGALAATAFCFWLAGLFWRKNGLQWSLAGGIASGCILGANLRSVIAYKGSPVLDKNSVEVLSKIGQQTNARDYLLTWWDYGTAAWYYSGANTICNPGQQNADIYLIAKILNSPSQALASNLSKVAVEARAASPTRAPIIRSLLQPHINSPAGLSGFFTEISSTHHVAPAKARDIYLFLNLQMLDFIPAMRLFSERDLLTGEPSLSRTFISFNNWNSDGLSLQASGASFQLDVDRRDLRAALADGRRFTLRSLDYIPASTAGGLSVKRQTGDPSSPFRLVIRENPPLCLLMEEEVYQSNFVQMFVYEVYDRERFERVAGNPHAIMYRVK